MYLVNTEHYTDLASKLVEAIDSKNFFTGGVYLETDDADCRFVATLIISYSNVSLPEGECDKICDITPIWWEYHTTTLDGEQINDFDFDIFKKHILCQ